MAAPGALPAQFALEHVGDNWEIMGLQGANLRHQEKPRQFRNNNDLARKYLVNVMDVSWLSNQSEPLQSSFGQLLKTLHLYHEELCKQSIILTERSTPNGLVLEP